MRTGGTELGECEMWKFVIILVTMLLITPAAWAGTLAGVTMADEVVIAGTTLHLNGMGLRRKIGTKIYVAGLYLEQITNSADAALNASGPKRFAMHYLTDRATNKRMIAAWIRGFKMNSPDIYEILEDRVMTFVNSLGDMKVGDVVECTMIPGEGTTVTLNGKENVIIEGDDFQVALLRVGIGAKPPSNPLKAGLLGNR
jgi:hypothetical protein